MLPAWPLQRMQKAILAEPFPTMAQHFSQSGQAS